MLEQLKSQVLIAYQELGRYGLDKYDRGSVSAIDRESGMIDEIRQRCLCCGYAREYTGRE